MAKYFSTGWIAAGFRKEERERVCAALERMGIVNDPAEWETLRWELLAWFVSFAQRDILVLTNEQCDLLDEEVQTIQLLATFNQSPWVPTREEMHMLSTRVLTILSALVDTGVVRIGPLPVEFVVLRGTDRQEDIPEAQRAKGFVMYEGWGPGLLGKPPAEGIAFQVPPIGVEGLIHVLAQLLSKFPGSVRRCPLCKKLFAQFRVSAQYCSRLCQSQAWARVQWECEKQKRADCRAKEAAKEFRSQREKNEVPEKGGNRHGKKK